MEKTRRRFSFRLVLVALGITYALLLGFGCSLADRLIFVPHRSSYQDSAGLLKLTTSDGKKIAAIFLPNSSARFTVLYSHGNGEDLGDDLPLLRAYQQHGFAVFAYDYHGYGLSTGHPSESAAYDDITTAYNYLTQQLHIPPARIIAHGHSLGTGVTIDLASRVPLAGMIVESAFVTTFRVRTHWTMLPVDEFRNIDKVHSVHCPSLFIHGTDDWVIGIWHSRALFDQANEPKTSYWVKGAGHNDIPEIAGEEYWRTIEKFAQSLPR